MSFSGDVEGAEFVLVLIGVGIIYFTVKKGLNSQTVKDATQAVNDAISNATANPVFTGPSATVGVGKPIPANQEFAISSFLEQPSFVVSPDRNQLWFPNGSFYDNRDGNVYTVGGNKVGPVFLPDGTVNSDAVIAVQ